MSSKIYSGTSVKKSVSFPQDLLAEIEAKALEQRRSLSAYLQNVAIADLNGKLGEHGPKVEGEAKAA
jgi:hypothetical protein